jgi:hypothetical protein
MLTHTSVILTCVYCKPKNSTYKKIYFCKPADGVFCNILWHVASRGKNPLRQIPVGKKLPLIKENAKYAFVEQGKLNTSLYTIRILTRSSPHPLYSPFYSTVLQPCPFSTPPPPLPPSSLFIFNALLHHI